MTLVSVVLCSYNQAEYLQYSIDSVLKQTHPDWELIVVDNGSTDSSQEIIRDNAARDARIRHILHETNGPITKRLNEGVRAAKGSLISLLYSDDYYLPQKMEWHVAQFAALGDEYGVVYSPGIRHDVRTGREWQDPTLTESGNIFHALLTQVPFIHPISPTVRRQCFEDFPFDEGFFVEGEGLFVRMAMKYKFHFDQRPSAVMRDTTSNIGRAIRRNTETMFLFVDKLKQSPHFPAAEAPFLEAMRNDLYRNAGWQGIRVVCDGAWARQMALSALRARPSRVLDPKIGLTLALSVAPPRFLRAFNTVFDRVRGTAGHRNYVADERLT